MEEKKKIDQATRQLRHPRSQGGKSGSWILGSCGSYRILWIHLDPLDPMDPMDPLGSFWILSDPFRSYRSF